MGNYAERHRPVMAGLRIKATRTIGGKPATARVGTLTGLATRNSDGKQVLVTCMHTMAHGFGNAINHSEVMYQVDHQQKDDKIGTILYSDPVSLVSPNTVDVAYCALLGGVEASYEPHFHGHEYRPRIIPGTKTPKPKLELIVLGGNVGAKKVEVLRLVDKPLKVKDASDVVAEFTGVVELGNTDLDSNTSFKYLEGDSGAPCLFKVGENSYQMSAILFGGNEDGTKAYAFPASAAEKELKITFGDPYGGVRMGKTWIIDDYFQAGETLHCGDVAVVRERPAPPNVPNQPAVPRVYKAAVANKGRVIGIVHTPPGKAVGDQIATRNAAPAQDEFVPIVVKGVAKTLTTDMIAARPFTGFC